MTEKLRLFGKKLFGQMNQSCFLNRQVEISLEKEQMNHGLMTDLKRLKINSTGAWK